MRNQGILITIEGIDGSGKSTIARALKDFLSPLHQVTLTKEPGGTELGIHLRAMLHTRTYSICPEAEFLLFLADRAQHINEVVRPALQAGHIVISDRMADSSRAYQAYGRGLNDTWIHSLNQSVMKEIVPNITIYLRINYETALQRMHKRNEQPTSFEKEKADFFKRLIEGYDTIFKERGYLIMIDANGSQETVHKQVIHKVMDMLTQHYHLLDAGGKRNEL